jgi:hypothetical protein
VFPRDPLVNRPEPADENAIAELLGILHELVSAERAQGGAIFRARIERCDQEDRGASKRRRYGLCEGRRSACYFGCVRRIGLHRASTLRRSGCLGITAGFLQVPAKLIAHSGKGFISEADLAATRTFPSRDDAANISTQMPPKSCGFLGRRSH